MNFKIKYFDSSPPTLLFSPSYFWRSNIYYFFSYRLLKRKTGSWDLRQIVRLRWSKGVSESEFLPQFSHQLFLFQKGKCWPRSSVCVVPETDQLQPFPDEIGKTRKIQLKLSYDAFDTKTFKRQLYFQLGLPSTKGLGTFHNRWEEWNKRHWSRTSWVSYVNLDKSF